VKFYLKCAKIKDMKKVLFLSCFLIVLSFPLVASSLTMESTNFKVVTDVVNVGGGLSTSTNYQIINTSGEMGSQPTQSTSTNFIIDSGFFGADSATSLAVTLSTDSINFGTLSLSSVASASQTLTVSTNAVTGYTTTINDDGDLRSGSNVITDIPINGTVTAGTAGYGISTSGSAGKMNSTTTSTPLTTSSQIVASNSAAAGNEETIITYKAAVGSGTAYGTYSHIVTFTTMVNY